MTRAQALVYNAMTDAPRTPAQIKRYLPGKTPVATIRTLLVQLQALGLVKTAQHPTTPGITAWVRA